MVTLKFDDMFEIVLSWWPKKLSVKENGLNGSLSLRSFYEKEIEPISLNYGSVLLSQLDWVVYAVIAEISQRTKIIRPREIRLEYIKERFHCLLREQALPQLKGIDEWDNSFDKQELLDYLGLNSL